MSFSDRKTLQRRLSRNLPEHFATIKFGHADHKSGVILRVEIIKTMGGIENLLAETFDLAASLLPKTQRINDPGWWAAMTALQALKLNYPPSVMRGQARSRIHACVIVEPGGMLDPYPLWPMVRLGTAPRLIDLRGEGAVPADSELEAYAFEHGIHSELRSLRVMFEEGVLEWGSGVGIDGRREIVAAR